MGQYYSATTIDKNGKLTVYSLQPSIFRETRNYDYYNGIKLMEHSWIGNSFTSFFSKLIYKNPLSVGWIGDYANSDFAKMQAFERNSDFRIPAEQYIDFYKSVWGDDSEHVDFPYSKRHFNYRNRYLVNHTKKCYFSLNSFANKKGEWIIYPISLLTCVGCFQGGGGYHENNADSWLVGTWALDVISIEDEIPEGYTCDDVPKFAENW